MSGGWSSARVRAMLGALDASAGRAATALAQVSTRLDCERWRAGGVDAMRLALLATAVAATLALAALAIVP
jgi:hypothetical protein